MQRFLVWSRWCNHRATCGRACVVCLPHLRHSSTLSKSHRSIALDVSQCWSSSCVPIPLPFFSASRGRLELPEKSPFAVLELPSAATVTKDEIKAAFRKLAKMHHPDLNVDGGNDDKMAEIIHAYQQLMDNDVDIGTAASQRVALACDMYTLSDLQRHPQFDIYAVRLLFEDRQEEGGDNETLTSLVPNTSLPSTERLHDVTVHSQDSVSDLKRALQMAYASQWNLQGRALDRDGVATGWEVLQRESTLESEHGTVLSGHFFLTHTYNVRHGDVLAVIVQKSVVDNDDA